MSAPNIQIEKQQSELNTDPMQRQYYYYKHNYYKNDLSFMEPQKPINLPEIKTNHKVNIEQQMKSQNMWGNFKKQSTIFDTENYSSNNQSSQQQFQFNYFTDRKSNVSTNSTNNVYNQKQNSKIPFKDEAKNQNSNKTFEYPNQHNSSSTTLNSESAIKSSQKQRFSSSREATSSYSNQTPSQAQKINASVINTNASKYTNLKEEKAKVSKILEEFERKQKLEKELKNLANSDQILHKTGGHTSSSGKIYETQTPEQQEYVQKLLQIKPWLSCLPLKASKLEYLKKNFPIDEASSQDILKLEGKDQEDYQAELEYIQNEVVSKRNMLREKKQDYELLMDARYFNKYGDYLYKRLQQKNFYQRLEISKEASQSQIKKSYFKLALIWHPDNIRKKYKFGFAYEEIFTKLVAEIFVLFEEAYKTLSNEESRKGYDSKQN